MSSEGNRSGSTSDNRSESSIEILLVEPNPGDSRLFEESFKEGKILNRLHTVSDGESALDFLHQRYPHTDAPRPDLILLEPQLPGKSGIDILSELNNEPALADIPVVVLTSSDPGEDIVKSHGLDTDHYLRKPVAADDFIDFVQSVEDFWLAVVQQ